MENKIQVVNKGYTITVTSWENDGDLYNTKSITLDTLEDTKDYYELLEFSKQFGNQCDIDEGDSELMKEFFENHPNILCGNKYKDADDYVDAFSDVIDNMLGNSEYYICRVIEKIVITYSPEDIYIEEIKF